MGARTIDALTDLLLVCGFFALLALSILGLAASSAHEEEERAALIEKASACS